MQDNGNKPKTAQWTIQDQFANAIANAADAAGIDRDQMLNHWLLLGKCVFDSIVLTAPIAKGLMERNSARIAASAIPPPAKKTEPDEVDPRTPEQIREDLQAIARGEKPSYTPPTEGNSEDTEETPS